MALVILGSMSDKERKEQIKKSHLPLFQGAQCLGWCQQRPPPFPHTECGIEEALWLPLEPAVSNLAAPSA